MPASLIIKAIRLPPSHPTQPQLASCLAFLACACLHTRFFPNPPTFKPPSPFTGIIDITLILPFIFSVSLLVFWEFTCLLFPPYISNHLPPRHQTFCIREMEMRDLKPPCLTFLLPLSPCLPTLHPFLVGGSERGSHTL